MVILAGTGGLGRRWPLVLLLGVLLSGSVGAQDAAVPSEARTRDRPLVALVLGGGAARGASHIGIIRALNEAGVPIDLIVGTSMGSVIGGLYAAGFSADTLANLIEAWSPGTMAELLFPPRGGILDAAPLELAIAALVNDLAISDTAIPFVAVATPLDTNVPEALISGSLATAIRASTTIPLLFTPVEIAGSHYYDGGVKAAVPVLIAKEFGADVVIAVDVTREIPYDPGNIIGNVQTIYLDIIEGFSATQLEAADLLIDPGLRQDSYMSFDRSSEFVAKGYRETVRRLPELLARLAERGVPLREPGDPNSGNPLNRDWQQRLRAGVRRAANRALPLSIVFDVGLAPSSYQSGYTMPATAQLSVARLGFDVTGGVFGPFRMGTTAGFALDSDATTLEFRAAYRPRYALELAAAWQLELQSAWNAEIAATYHYSDFDDVTAEASLRLRLPSGLLQLDGTFDTTGFLGTAAVSAPTSGSFVRGTVDLRTALTIHGFLLRARGFAGGVYGTAPSGEQLGFGQPVWMRGVSPTPSTGVVVVNLEAGWHATAGAPMAEVLVLHPELWGFVDLGYALPEGQSPAVTLGVGAGVPGALFGLEPFELAVDVGYGLTTGQVTIGIRTRVWPAPFEVTAPEFRQAP